MRREMIAIIIMMQLVYIRVFVEAQRRNSMWHECGKIVEEVCIKMALETQRIKTNKEGKSKGKNRRLLLN